MGGCTTIRTISVVIVLVAVSVGVPRRDAQGAETADWLPLRGTYQVWCTWNNGCDGGYHAPSLHPSIDFGASVGTRVYAAGPGRVERFGGCHATDSWGCNGGAGNYIRILHPDGRYSRYLHLSSFDVGNGAQVSRGQLIGRTGNSGTSTAPHLHYDETNASRTKIEPGSMFALHGDRIVRYPQHITGTSRWQGVTAFRHNVRNDGYQVPDTEAPTGSLDRPRPMSRWYPQARIQVSGVFEDDLSVAKVEFQRRVGSGSWSRFATDSRGGNGRYAATYHADHPVGTWLRFRAVAFDRAGNTRGTDARTVRLSGSPLPQRFATADVTGDGRTDVLLGLPETNVDDRPRAGSVELYPGTDDGFRQTPSATLTLGSADPHIAGQPARDDLAGSAIAVGDFDGDEAPDLVIGSPGKDAGGVPAAGMVMVTRRAFTGDPGPPERWWHGDGGLGGALREGDATGAALEVGDFDGDGFQDLAVGGPGKRPGGVWNAGAVSVTYGSTDGLDRATSALFNQATNGMPGAPNPADRLGAALAAGDFNGDGYDDLGIGAPGEHPGGQLGGGHGAVTVLYGGPQGLSTAGATFWYQGNAGLPGTPQPDDLFGNVLAAGDLNGDGSDELAVSVVFDNPGALTRAGSVHILRGGTEGINADDDLFLHQGYDRDGLRLSDQPQSSAHFGASVAFADLDADGFDDLLVGVTNLAVTQPLEGAVHVIRGDEGGVSPHGYRLLTAADVGREPVERMQLGSAAAVGDVNNDGAPDILSMTRDGGPRPVAALSPPPDEDLHTAESCAGDLGPAPFNDREDIPTVHRANVDCAAQLDIVTGFEDETYRPGDAVRRDQMASFILRTLEALGTPMPDPDGTRFSDIDPGSVHDEAIHRLAAAGIVKGRSDESYDPRAIVRRDQMASFLIRAAEFATDRQWRSPDRRFDDVPESNVHASAVNGTALHGLAKGFPDGTYHPADNVRRDQMATFIVRLHGGLSDS